MRKKRTAGELAKRYSLFVFSLFVSAVGVALTKKANLGMFPISSVPNMLSMEFNQLTLGNWLIIWNLLLIIGQILLLRKNFQVIQLLQLPLSVLFGYFTDFAIWMFSPLQVKGYIMQVILVILGILVIAMSVFLAVTADVVMNSAEAFVKAVSDTSGVIFPKVKTVFDVSCVVTSILLSLFFFNMQVIGTREGTVVAALFTGSVVGFYTKKLKQPLLKLMNL